MSKSLHPLADLLKRQQDPGSFFQPCMEYVEITDSDKTKVLYVDVVVAARIVLAQENAIHTHNNNLDAKDDLVQFNAAHNSNTHKILGAGAICYILNKLDVYKTDPSFYHELEGKVNWQREFCVKRPSIYDEKDNKYHAKQIWYVRCKPHQKEKIKELIEEVGGLD